MKNSQGVNNNNNNNKFLLIAAQKNTIKTNYIKAKMDKIQRNSRCSFCGNEAINHIICKCIKLAQSEYKTRHDWAEKVIYWELCKKFKFDHTNKWYMHNPESVLDNETHKLSGILRYKRIA